MTQRSRKRSSSPSKPKPKSKAEPPVCEDGENDPVAEEAFVESLIATGQAAKPDADGKLPAGATHELVESETGDKLKAVRRRFSIY